MPRSEKISPAHLEMVGTHEFWEEIGNDASENAASVEDSDVRKKRNIEVRACDV